MNILLFWPFVWLVGLPHSLIVVSISTNIEGLNGAIPIAFPLKVFALAVFFREEVIRNLPRQ